MNRRLRASQVALRVALATIVIAAPVVMAGWFATCPQYGNPACPEVANPLEVLAAFRAADLRLQQVFLLLNALAPYTYPLSYLILGLLALEQSPWFAVLGIASGWIGATAWAFIADTMLHIAVFASSNMDQAFAIHEAGYFASSYVLGIAFGWVLGHLLGYVFVGIALLRARAVAPWAAWMLIASAPIMGPLAYMAKLGILQVAGYLMVLVGSVPAALVILDMDRRLVGRSGGQERSLN